MRLLERPRIAFQAASFAPAPAEWRGIARDEVRLLVADSRGLSDIRFRDIGQHLRAGDVLVVNNSATVPAELDAELGGKPIVVHLGAVLDDSTRVVELRTAPDAGRAILDASSGGRVQVGSASLELLEAWPEVSSPTGVGNRWWRAGVSGDLARELAQHGRPIAYGYLDRRYPLSAYQSVFGQLPGSVEMASAGRPFTAELVTGLVSCGVEFAPITLHTGLSSQEAGEAPGPEWFEVSEPTAQRINAARAAGGRIIAVGTTATRAVESASVRGQVRADRGWTTRVVTPEQPPRVVSGLITGWHDPHASHLLLVEAVAGREVAQDAYDQAVARDYLWHEFGDSALLLRE